MLIQNVRQLNNISVLSDQSFEVTLRTVTYTWRCLGEVISQNLNMHHLASLQQPEVS